MDYKRDIKTVYLGDRIKVRTIRGVKGNIIGQLPDGRTIIFDRDSPYHSMLSPGQLVECNVVRVSERYVIVDPIREPRERTEPPEIEKAGLLEDLRRLSEEGGWEKAIIAGALMHIIEKLDASRETSPSRSSQKTDSVAEESPVDHPPDPPLSDELRRASDSFGLTQPKLWRDKSQRVYK
jgi:hypothetical protein